MNLLVGIRNFMKLRNKFSLLLAPLVNNVFYKNILLVASGTVLAQLLGVFTSPIISRIYLPQDFGELSVLMAFVGILASISTLRFETPIQIERNNRLCNNLVNLCFIILLTYSILLTIVIVFFDDNLLNFIGSKLPSYYLYFIPILVFFTSSNRVLLNWKLRQKEFKIISKLKVIQSVSNSTSKISFGFLKYDSLGLILGTLISEILLLIGYVKSFISSQFSFFVFNKGDVRFILKKYKRFPIYQTWSQLLLSFGPRLPIFFIGDIFGFKALGFYALTNSMLSLPVNLVGDSVSKVYFSQIAELGKDNIDKVLILTRNIVKKLFLVGLLLTLIILLGSEFLFVNFFGENWLKSGQIAKVLILVISGRLVVSPLMSLLNLLNLQNIQLIINIIRMFLITSIFLIGNYFEFSFIETVSLYSLSLIFFYISIYFFVINKASSYEIYT